MLRILYALTLVPPKKQPQAIKMLMAKIVELSRQDEMRSARLIFEETNVGWVKTSSSRSLACSVAYAMA
jgi:hypothetical protein